VSQTPIFGYAGEVHPRKGRATIKRDKGGHERWADAIMPADAEAGVIETPTNRRPLIVVAALVVISAAILAFQLAHLQIFDGQRNLGLADGNRLRQKITRASRGVIYDRHNQPLVNNLASIDLNVTPSLLPRDSAKRQALYAQVGQLVGMNQQEMADKVENNCVTAKMPKLSRERAVFDCLGTSQPRLIASNISRDAYLTFDQASASVPGFSLDSNPIREYTDGGSLAAILGYTGRVNEVDLTDRSYTSTDFIGKLGIEKGYEELLRGQNGSEQTEVDASGRPIKVLSAQESKPGSNLVLSVDMELQHKLAESIQTQMQASGSKQAAGIALNPKTGEVLAAVNMPTYDNNLFAKGISQNDYSKLLKDPAQPLFNKVIGGAYPTGSIIKPLIGSAALQEHVVSTSTSVDDKGSLEIPNKYDPKVTYTFRSYEHSGLGIVNITKAIAVSSNVFFFTVGGGFGNIGGLGVDRLTSYYQKFGLGHKTGVDIPEETAGSVPTPASKKKATGEDWYLGDTYNISVGQGDLRASPLQMAVATAAVANGGSVLKPHFLKEVKDASGRVTQTVQPEVVQKDFISPANLTVIRNAMRQVVSAPYGTACCNIERQVPVAVAAKTGTAETDPNGNRKPHAWFTAYAPFDDPQIVIVVLVANSGEGAQYAAPAVRETLAWCFSRPGGCVQ
jgi:penicillin-binding protein 2